MFMLLLWTLTVSMYSPLVERLLALFDAMIGFPWLFKLFRPPARNCMKHASPPSTITCYRNPVALTDEILGGIRLGRVAST